MKQVYAAVSAMLFILPLLCETAVYAGREMDMRLTSTAFKDGEAIPSRYTCEGADISPPLLISGVPAGTRSLALIVDDPDAPDPAAPKTTWVHWVLFNLPPDLTEIREAADTAALPATAVQGLNDWKRPGYGGPCPPIGRHRYFFKLYALDNEPAVAGSVTKARLETAMEGHVLQQTVLMGTYRKSR